MKKNFLFSVIITIYNAEDFLEEAIKSVIRQTIGFKENIQLILVNNATEDDCGSICEKYKEMYPDNIEYVVLKKNRGAAGGRNAGLPYVKGKYFNYLDADDVWGRNAFEEAYKFLEKHRSLDLVSVRRKNFGRQKGYHHTDYKFTKKDRVIDIFKEYNAVQFHVTSCFFKTKTCIHRKFNEKIGIGEDSEYAAEIILQKGKYGALRDNVYYYYRKREDGQSALDSKENKKSYFLNDYHRILDGVIKSSKKYYGKVVPFIQYHMVYETGWLLKGSCSILNEEELAELKKQVVKFLSYIDDEIILINNIMKREHKVFSLELKHGSDYIKNMSLDKLKEMGLFSPVNRKNITFETLDIEDSKLLLSATVSVFPDEKRWKIYLVDQDDNKYYPYRRGGDLITKSLNENIFSKHGYFWEIDLKGKKNIVLKPAFEIDNDVYNPSFICDRWTKSTNKVKGSYYYDKTSGYMTRFIGNRLKLVKTKKPTNQEIKYLLRKIKSLQFKVVRYRLLNLITKPFYKKKVLLISDRIYSSDDNGELFYKWIINSDNNKEVKAYYVVDERNEDITRIKKYGKIVYFNSLKYKILYMHAHAIISSMVDGYIFAEPFGGHNIDMRDFDVQRVCLGHGISEQDMHRTEGKFSNNFRMYAVASSREQKIKTSTQYGYTDREIKLTGVPRFDYIYNLSKENKEKVILFAPTWRNKLSGQYINGVRVANPSFKYSEYFEFYNNLINDKRILDVMKKYGYKGVFNIHPMHKPNIDDFEGNEIIKIQEEKTPYIDQFSKNRMVVTDYSSIGHDYAYANSSVIYTQFDVDTFYRSHTYDKGTFDYEKDGFGPVCYDYESAVKLIVKAIKNDCKVEKKYEDRTKNYFKYFDNKNCERIYDEIMKL